MYWDIKAACYSVVILKIIFIYFLGSAPTCLFIAPKSQMLWTRPGPKPGSENSTQVSCVGHRNPINLSLYYCLPGLAGNWSEKTEPGVEPGHSSRLNDCPSG